MVSLFIFIFPVHVSGRLEYNSLFVGLGVVVRGSEQTFGCKSVDDNWDGLNV